MQTSGVSITNYLDRSIVMTLQNNVLRLTGGMRFRVLIF